MVRKRFREGQDQRGGVREIARERKKIPKVLSVRETVRKIVRQRLPERF